MRKRRDMGAIGEKRLLNIEEVCAYTGMGKTKARKYMDEISATRHFGKKVVFDKTVIDGALDILAE